MLPSSALMLSVPAGIAGCKIIVLATPPRFDGTITPEVLWCAKRAGVTHILKAGGAQAVAAMAWGTETCPKVHKHILLKSSLVPSQGAAGSLQTCMVPLASLHQCARTAVFICYLTTSVVVFCMLQRRLPAKLYVMD